MKERDKSLKPLHPGEILSEEFMKPMGITQYRLAKDLSVKPLRISEIVRGKRGITADTALRLGSALRSLCHLLDESTGPLRDRSG